MKTKSEWTSLSSEQKVELLKAHNDEELTSDYLPSGMSSDDFRRQLIADRAFWDPDNLQAKKTAGDAPTKDTTIGAWRDLNKAEALLELIDNSVDAWMKRKKEYPRETAPRLQIYIDLDEDSHTLTFADNAGGVQEEKLINLVIPGYSDTKYIDLSIGSYHTGGKKAIFKLASEANIKTRYWSPVGTSDQAFEIHLDKGWLENPTEYEFPYYPIKDIGVIERGRTICLFRIRNDASGGVWDREDIEKITNEIRRTYTLLMLRHPEIEIYFIDRENPLTPLEDLYRFTGVKDKKVDLRPQRANFKCQLEWQGKSEEITIEIVLGCRTTTAAQRGNDSWGIDLYGNDRLFTLHETEEVFDWFDLPKGAARGFIRGFINIHGPNIFIPWDTHKRHLNTDREIVTILRKNREIKEFFEAWKQAYNNLSQAEEIKKTINQKLDPWRSEKDLNIPIFNEITVDSHRKRRREATPSAMHKPVVPVRAKRSDAELIRIAFKITKHEYRILREKYEIRGSPDDPSTLRSLAAAIKESIIE